MRTVLCLLCLAASAGAGLDDGRIDLGEFARVVEYVGTTPETLQVKTLERGVDGWTAWKGPDGQYMIGLEFDEPRDIAETCVEFRHAIAERQLIQVQYFRQHWPNNQQGGWAPLDDPFHGEWVTVKGDWWAGDRDVCMSFARYSEEQPGKGAPDYRHRRTYRLRFLLGTRELPPVRYLRAFGPGEPATAEFQVRLEPRAALRLPLDLSVANGLLLEGQARIPSTLMPLDEEPIEFAVRYAREDLRSPNRTIVTLRSAENARKGVSFLPAEVVQHGQIRVPALGVTVAHKGAAPQTRPAEQPGQSIYDRVATQPAPTFERARREIPELDYRRHNRYVPLGPPDARQELAVAYDGSLVIAKSALKCPAGDSERMKWPADYTTVRLRTGEPAADQRAAGKVRQHRLDGYLPIVIGAWEQGGVRYEQTCVATYLNGEPQKPRADETVVLLSRVAMTNPTSQPLPAAVRLSIEPAEQLQFQNGHVLAIAGVGKDGLTAYPRSYYRLFFKAPGAALEKLPDTPAETVVAWKGAVPAGGSEVIEWRTPYVDIGEADRERIAALEFDQAVAFEADRWRKLVARAATFEVPEPLLADFYKASLVNLAITADLDPHNGMRVLPAGTFQYNVCLNESCHQVRSLEMRGLHQDAREYLDSMIRGQSTRGLHGRFTDQKGVLHGMPTATGDYQTFNYNLDHGFVLWTLNEHYRYTRDRDWLARVAPALIEACDFVTRQCTVPPESNALASDDRYWGIGLLPPGHLEDPPEWLWWFAVNAYAYRGMQATAESLKEIGHPQAQRIGQDARLFGDNLRNSCREAMVRAPVVRLRDGTYVPFQPTRSRLRGRDLGWIRDALYGPIHLIDCGVYPAESPEAEWILRDAEDNVFVGLDRGFDMPDFERQWYSWGGMTLQPNLLPIPTVYLNRDMPRHALRGFFNALCVSVYADVRLFSEWVRRPGIGGGPFYKTPDEAAFIVWMRQLLINERGDDLELLAAVPPEWLAPGRRIVIRNAATHFGPMDLTIEAGPDGKELALELAAPKRNPPQWIRIRAGSLGRVSAVTLDGKTVSSFDARTGVIELNGRTGSARLEISY